MSGSNKGISEDDTRAFLVSLEHIFRVFWELYMILFSCTMDMKTTNLKPMHIFAVHNNCIVYK